MSFDNWGFALASPGNDDKARIVNKAIDAVFSLMGFNYHGETDYLIPEFIPELCATRKLIIIPSICEEALRKYWKDILRIGYGPFTENTGLDRHRYLFVDTGTRSIFFEILSRIFRNLDVGGTTSYARLFPAILELMNGVQAEEPQISSRKIQYQIEQIGFTSGAEEIQELIYRNLNYAHDFFNAVTNKKMQKPSVRLLLGAFASGDVARVALLNSLYRIKRGVDIPDHILEWLKEIEEDQRNIGLEKTNLSSLPSYLSNRRILLIEDQLGPELWNIVLPVLFGSERARIKRNSVNEGKVIILHADNSKKALNLYGPILDTLDIILLDLYVSENDKSKRHDSHSGLTLSSVGESVMNLIENLKYHYHKQIIGETDGNFVLTALPKIVVFSIDTTGLTARTLLKELGASDYFFKIPIGEPHKGGYYASFRNALIKPLKETVSNVLGISYLGTTNKLDNWLRQFLPADRPLILRIMKHFRYYSAMSIVKTLNKFLKNNTNFNDDRSMISLFGNNYLKLHRFLFSYLGRPNKSGPATLALFAKTDWVKDIVDMNQSHHTQHHLEDKKIKFAPFLTYDDLQEIIFEESIAGVEEDLCVIITDDIMGSGGQLESYSWKFINRHLRKLIKEKIGRPDIAKSKWEKLCEFFIQDKNTTEIQKVIKARNKSTGKIQLHAIFAIGIRNRSFEGCLEEIRVNGEPLDDLIKKDRIRKISEWMEKTTAISLSGKINVALCKDPKHKGIAGKGRCTCERVIPFFVHIVEYTPDIDIICKKEKIKLHVLRELLKRYSFLTTPRKKEYPCDFEPMGWKDSGGLVATYANCPGNTLPIIWGDRRKRDDRIIWDDEYVDKWVPLFPRFFNPMDQGSSIKTNLFCKRTGKCKLRQDLGTIDLSGNNKPPCKP